ncbi:SIMPL domain-containing protein [Paenibacillus soyae]|uniref:SIMPL domain-containing protein n=1 Tax=Paenibacillus soyae TaxID=2969249 RepID=A0A9X2MPU0_9BACL|nr:SIMPL domain-containing protein [Paenibacillus soyae]MCR2803596.1 SIMPL domain-containing protein [Paenibacillus soyae]
MIPTNALKNGGGSCDFTIEVIGEGMAVAAPDRTHITLGVVTEGKDVQPAQKENAEKIEAIIAALERLGVPRENIQTKTYSIEPQYDYADGVQTFRGYKVTHLLGITLDGVAGAGAVIDAAVAQGANAITDIVFLSSESAKFEALALREAVRSAQEKAAAIAGALGVSLSAIPCKVQELGQEAAPIRFKTAALSMADSQTPIEPGQLTFRAAVRVWYVFA